MSMLKLLRQLLDDKKMSVYELTLSYLRTIRNNQHINAFISINDNNALNQAKRIDDFIINSDKKTLLTGIPIAHKDNLCTKNLKTTCASKILSNYYSPFNATVVENLLNQNTVLLGKTNMDEFGMGSSNENSFFGSVKNPHDLSYVPGGSSGGSAAAVSAGLSPFATGSDTGGSVRQPASFCGITGMKPSYGTISRYGLVAYGSSFDQVGIMAHYAEDCAYLLQAMSGKDSKDNTNISVSNNFFTKSIRNKSPKNLIMGVDEKILSNLPRDMQHLLQNCIFNFKKQGIKIQNINLPDLKAVVAAYYILASGEAATNLARFDGIRYGYRSKKAETLEELYINTRTEGFGPEVKRRIVMGNYVLASNQYETYYYKAQQIRQKIKQELNKVYQKVNIILLPVTRSVAPKLGSLNVPVNTYLSDVYTLIANLTGAPAITFPAGKIGKLPYGLQLMANNFNDHLLLQAVCAFQRQTKFHRTCQKLLQELNI